MHMQPQVVFGKWVEVDTFGGIIIIPLDQVPFPDVAGVAPFLGLEQPVDDKDSIRVIEGWGARLSAPGYMDCTEWCVSPSEDEARQYLCEMYDIEIHE